MTGAKPKPKPKFSVHYHNKAEEKNSQPVA
jgi:hypothetical protein